jgi:hypothetical protein
MDKDDVQEWVKEAVSEALVNANLVDGPTHIRHHQVLQEFCETYNKVKLTGITVTVTAIVTGIITVCVLGIRAWMASPQKGG